MATSALCAAVLVALVLGEAAGPVAARSASKLPSSYKLCKQNDPDFNGCLKTALQKAVPSLKKGIPSLGVPSIDPMPFATIKIEQLKKDRPVTADLELDNLVVYDMSKGSVDSVEMVPGSYHMKAHLHSDYPIHMVGTYKVDGKVLVLPVVGQGACNITAIGLHADLEMFGEPLERDGDVYWDIKNFTVKMDLKGVKMHLDNLFNGDKLLGDNVNRFLNENADLLMEELQPFIEMGLAASDMEVSRRLFNAVPYNSIFPPQ